jgi:putative membrane protein
MYRRGNPGYCSLHYYEGGDTGMPHIKVFTATTAALFLALAPAVPALAAGQPSEQDRRFLAAAHQSNLTEISAGQLAQERGASRPVSQLGARFITDHSRLDRAVRGVAEELGVDLPDAPNPRQQAILSQLQATSGEAFDARFIATQLEIHVAAMRLGEQELAQGSDRRVIQLAREAAPVIAAHHEALRAAAETLGLPTEVDTGSGGQAAAAGSTRTAGLAILAGGLVLLAAAAYRRRARRTAPGPAPGS